MTLLQKVVLVLVMKFSDGTTFLTILELTFVICCSANDPKEKIFDPGERRDLHFLCALPLSAGFASQVTQDNPLTGKSIFITCPQTVRVVGNHRQPADTARGCMVGFLLKR